ncbi:MAG: hypothetical protein H0W15_11170 [Gemmatimonadales bacterium]|nr:hypothetical protein [Gemmatimonadales bacterium]
MNHALLDDALDAAARLLRGASGLARLMLGVTSAAVLLAVAAWLFRLGALDAPGWVLAVWVGLVVAVLTGLAWGRHAIRALGPWHVARRLEVDGAWRRGSLTTVLDGTARGTSSDLHDAAIRRSADDVAARAGVALAPHVDIEVHRARRALMVTGIALVALFAARPARGATARLWHPLAAWHAITGAVRLDAVTPVVPRGGTATFKLRAIGHGRATLSTRSPGEAWQETEVILDPDGAATHVTAPLHADMVARLEAGGRRSPEVRVQVRLPAFLGAFTATAHYPAYLGLEPETFTVAGDTLVLPEGTRLALSGRATAAISEARLDASGGSTRLDVAGEAFQGDLIPRRDDTWLLRVALASGAALDGESPAIPVRIVPDSAPLVEVAVPGVDTVAPPSMSLAVVVSVRDDHGVSGAALEWRIGARGTPRRTALSLEDAASDRALVATALDLAALGLRAGDTMFYAATATDNAPARHAGRSREFAVRIPTAGEQQDQRAQATGEAAIALDSLATRARRMQRQTENLAQERRRADSRSGGADTDPMTVDAARKAEAAAQAQEQLMAQAEQARQAVSELERAAGRDGLADSALAAQLGEIRELLEEALTPELRQKLDELRAATKALDSERTRDALTDLAKQQAALRDALERARELFKRAALETEMANMAQEARRLADAQKDVNKKLGQADSAAAAARAEESLAAATDSLASTLDRAAAKVQPQQTKEGMRAAARQARSAAQKMRQAASQSRDGEQQQAKSSGEAAEQQLDALEQQLDEEREEMQRAMREEVTKALDRALAETSRLAERQQAVAEGFRRGALVTTARTEQGLLEEGATKVLMQVVEAATKNALVSPQIAAAFGAARVSMRAAIEAVSTASPNLREAADEAGNAVDALAVAAYQLLRSRDKVGGSKSGSGVEEAMQQMQQMAGKQGEMAQQGQGMLQEGEGGMQQLMQLAMQQRAMAQQLERMRAAGQVPGAGEMGREAMDLSRNLEAGRLSRETVERQQRLFRRMIDAGRMLQGEEQDETKERRSEAPQGAVVALPGRLDPDLLRDNVVRVPNWEALQRLSPDDRRRVLDYFRRLADVNPP